MPVKIALITDIHYDSMAEPGGVRRSEIADVLLEKAVGLINLKIRPDVTLILGDIHDHGSAAHAGNDYRRLHGILSALRSSWLIIPGNHDCPAQEFYRFMPRPVARIDIGGIRFAGFVDQAEPEYNASRLPLQIREMEQLRADGWSGGIVTFQHVPVFPRGSSRCPYSYSNGEEIITSLHRNRVTIAVSGHYHKGFDLYCDGPQNYLAVPGFSESPFPLLELELAGEKILSLQRYELEPGQ